MRLFHVRSDFDWRTENVGGPRGEVHDTPVADELPEHLTNVPDYAETTTLGRAERRLNLSF